MIEQLHINVHEKNCLCNNESVRAYPLALSSFFLPFRATMAQRTTHFPQRIVDKTKNRKEIASLVCFRWGTPFIYGCSSMESAGIAGGWGDRAFHPYQSLHDNGLGPYHLNRRWRLATQQGHICRTSASAHKSGPGGRASHAAKLFPSRARENGPLAILRDSGTTLRRP